MYDRKFEESSAPEKVGTYSGDDSPFTVNGCTPSRCQDKIRGRTFGKKLNRL